MVHSVPTRVNYFVNLIIGPINLCVFCSFHAMLSHSKTYFIFYFHCTMMTRQNSRMDFNWFLLIRNLIFLTGVKFQYSVLNRWPLRRVEHRLYFPLARLVYKAYLKINKYDPLPTMSAWSIWYCVTPNLQRLWLICSHIIIHLVGGPN